MSFLNVVQVTVFPLCNEWSEIKAWLASKWNQWSPDMFFVQLEVELWLCATPQDGAEEQRVFLFRGC